MTIEEQREMKGKINELTEQRKTIERAWSVIADKIEEGRNTGNLAIVAKYLPTLKGINNAISAIEAEINELSDVYIKAVTA